MYVCIHTDSLQSVSQSVNVRSSLVGSFSRATRTFKKLLLPDFAVDQVLGRSARKVRYRMTDGGGVSILLGVSPLCPFRPGAAQALHTCRVGAVFSVFFLTRPTY
jgi:hypothetical protein